MANSESTSDLPDEFGDQDIVRVLGFASVEQLRRELQPALDELENGQLQPWNVEEFLTRMHQSHAQP